MAEFPSVMKLAICVQRIRYSLLAAHTILLWDLFSLLEEEFRLVYKSPLTSVKAVYLICRYYPLLIWPMEIWSLVWDQDLRVCEGMKYLEVFLIPLQVLPRSMFMIRAWAFSGRDPYVLCLLSAGLALYTGIHICGYILDILNGTGGYLFPVLGRTGCFHQHTGVRHRLFGYVLLLGLLLDLLVMVIIIAYSLRRRNVKGKLGQLLMLQGIGFCVLMVMLNVLSAYFFFGPDYHLNGTGYLFYLILPNIIACRFILRLRREARPSEADNLRVISRLVRDAFTSPA